MNDQEQASKKHVVVQGVIIWWHLVLQGAVVVGTGSLFEQGADVHGGHIHRWLAMQPVHQRVPELLICSFWWVQEKVAL